MISAVDVVYLVGLGILSPVWMWRLLRHRHKYREGWREKLFGEIPFRQGSNPCVWLHAVSVGEVNLLRPLIDELRCRYPHWEVFVSTTTQTGMQVARKKYPELTAFFCPMDFSWAVRRAMTRLRPELLVLTELEVWPQLIAEAKAHGARVAVVNGRLSDRSFRGYRLLAPLLRTTFRSLDAVGAQDTQTAERFRRLGTFQQNVVVTGSLKFDGAESDRNNPRTMFLRRLAGLEEDEVIFLAGSTQEGEEAMALEVFKRLFPKFPRLRLILVPRHPERFDGVAASLEKSGLPWIRRSRLCPPAAPQTPNGGDSGCPCGTLAESPQTAASRSQFCVAPRPVILVDTVGELSAWWGTADIAFVGGSFGHRGGQNMLEPAAYGAAVSFGPNTWNFRDIVRLLLQAEAAVVVRSLRDLEAFVRRCLEDSLFARQLGERAKRLVMSHRGATKRTLQMLAPYLEGGASPQHRLRQTA